jgi:hypothetical protein
VSDPLAAALAILLGQPEELLPFEWQVLREQDPETALRRAWKGCKNPDWLRDGVARLGSIGQTCDVREVYTRGALAMLKRRRYGGSWDECVSRAIKRAMPCPMYQPILYPEGP